MLKKMVMPGILLLCVLLFIITHVQIKKKEGRIGRLLDPNNLDRSIDPKEDFFLYANGNWLKNNVIPADETRWGSLNILEENNLKIIYELLEQASIQASSSLDPAVKKLGDLYKSGMDTSQIEHKGIAPIKGYLGRIDQINSRENLLREILLEHQEGFNPLFDFYVTPDDKNIAKQLCKFSQGGLGLIDPEDYIADDEESKKMLHNYSDYVQKIHLLSGDLQELAIQKSKHIINFEQALARASMNRSERQNINKLYHKLSIDEANRMILGLDWRSMLRGLKVTHQDTIIVCQPYYFAQVARQLDTTSLDIWKDYLKFHLLNQMAPYLSKSFQDVHFDFYNRKLRGQVKQQERWKFILSVIQESLGDLLGQIYVDKTFPPQAKRKMTQLADNIQKTFKERIARSDWMTEPTKKKALRKIDKITQKIGYPLQVTDYSKLKIVSDNFASNVLAVAAFQYSSMIEKLSRPTNKQEWNLTATTVNARFNHNFNEIVFPAALLQYASNYKMTEDIDRYEIIFSRNLFNFNQRSKKVDYKIILPSVALQYPYFSENADDAVNYGSIGAFIAHEMSHGFDSKGRYYDEWGNLNDWWSSQDEFRFNQKTSLLIKQFDEYTVFDSIHVDGRLTLIENTADLAGISIAYEAFKKTKQGKGNVLIDGFTPDQRFFLSWAQLWRMSSTNEDALYRIKHDHHAPYRWRCNGILSNIPEFHKAFGVTEKNKMYRAPLLRAKIW